MPEWGFFFFFDLATGDRSGYYNWSTIP